MKLGLSLFLIFIVSAGFYYDGYFKFWWKELVDANGFFDHFAAIFGFLFVTYFAVAIAGFFFAMAFMTCRAIFESTQKKTGLILPYLRRKIEEEKQRERERVIAAEVQAKADAEATLQQKHDADICADFGEVMAKYDLASFFIDEKRLQHSKVDIRSAILRQIQRHKRNNQAVNSLEVALVFLPSFQPKIGIKPVPKDMLSMMKSDGIHLEDFPAESEEFKKIVDEYLKKFKKIEKKVAKYESLWEAETNSIRERQ